MRRIFGVYQRILNAHPIAVQSFQTSLLMGAGDVCAQIIVEKKSLKQYRPYRTATFSCLGILLIGPALTIWYRTLAKYVGTKGKAVALKKMVLDQAVFAPCMMLIFLPTLGVIQGKTLDVIENEIRNKYGHIMLANYKLWPAVQFLNFSIIPTNYQVLVVQTVALFWNTYLSWKTQTKV